jgi:hypothetical protein
MIDTETNGTTNGSASEVPRTANEIARAYEEAIATGTAPVVPEPLEEKSSPATATATTSAPPIGTPPNGTPSETPSEAPQPTPAISANPSGLRLRMKIWTDPTTSKRYLMPSAFMRDVVNGQPVTDVMYAYAMSDDHTMMVTLTAREWNSLPFFYFQEDGWAPRASERPLDMVG